jgi:hypothetical protein
MEKELTSFETTIGDLQWAIGSLKGHSTKGTLLNAVRLLLCWDNPSFLKERWEKLSEPDKIKFCDVYVRDKNREHVLEFCDVAFGELTSEIQNGQIIFKNEEYNLARSNWILEEPFTARRFPGEYDGINDVTIYFSTAVKFPEGRFPITQYPTEMYERSFPVKDILKLMRHPYASRFTCHAISFMISGRNINDCTSIHNYRAPYNMICSEIFIDQCEQMSRQVVNQILPFVNFGDFMGLNPIDLDYSFKDWVDREMALESMLQNDPNAVITIRMNAPTNFENFFKD